ncbi:MAG: hypothetical protein ABJE95_22185 [Byssovorax sp.]
MSEEASKLAGVIDGVAMTEEGAKTLWREFSEHMDANRGDMAGYAKKRGWFSVAPEYRGGKAVLIVKTTANARGAPPVAAPRNEKPRPQQKAKPGGKPQQKAGPKPAQKPQPKAAPKPQPKASPKKPNQPPKPTVQGGQAPPKKRPA